MDKSSLTFFHVGRGLAGVAVFLGLMGAAGWLAGFETLTSLLPQWPSMKMNTAISIITLGTCLLFPRLLRLALPALPLLIGLASLAEYLGHVNLGIDQLLVDDKSAIELPGRMSIITAVIISLTASSIIIARIGERWSYIWQTSALFNLMLSLLALTAYAFDATALATIYPYSTVAIHTAFALLLINLAHLHSAPNTGWAREVFSPRFGGRMARLLMPMSVLALLLVGAITKLNIYRAFFGASVDRAFIVTLGSGVLLWIIWRLAVSLNTLDQKNEDQRDSLATLNEHLRLMIDHSPGAAAMFDTEMKYLWASQRWIEDFDLEGKQLVGISHYETFPGLSENWKAIHRRCLAGAIEKADEDVFVRADGSAQWIRWEVRPWRTGAGEIGGIIIFSENISEQKQRQDAEKFRSVVEGSFDAIMAVSKEGIIQLCNNRLEQIFGYQAGELKDKPYEILIPERYRRKHHVLHQGYVANPSPRPMGSSVDLWGLRKDGTEFPVDISLGPAKFPAGCFVTAIVRDISVRKKYESDLKKSIAAREAILSVVSHDLKNPAAAAEMSAELLMRSDITIEQAHAVGKRLKSSSSLMQRLICDLLDFSKIHAGTFAVKPSALRVSEPVRTALELMSEKAKEKEITLELQLPDDLPEIAADRDRVIQIIWNLVGNAIKFSPARGKVGLRAVADGGFVQFTVADSGPGIAEENLSKIFEQFWQDQRTAESGAGLGLFIVKGVVKAHGGHVWAESKLGKGTQIHFRLPISTGIETAKKLAAADRRGGGQVDIKGIHVLLVEDSSDNLELLTMILRHQGAMVTEAYCLGVALLECARCLPQIVVTDIEMPDGDGYLLLEKIRRLYPNLPVVALTSHSSEDSVSKMRAAGFDAILTKTGNTEELVSTIARLTSSYCGRERSLGPS